MRICVVFLFVSTFTCWLLVFADGIFSRGWRWLFGASLRPLEQMDADFPQVVEAAVTRALKKARIGECETMLLLSPVSDASYYLSEIGKDYMIPCYDHALRPSWVPVDAFDGAQLCDMIPMMCWRVVFLNRS